MASNENCLVLALCFVGIFNKWPFIDLKCIFLSSIINPFRKALEERVHLGTRSERVPQTEERERNAITFFQGGTERERNAHE